MMDLVVTNDFNELFNTSLRLFASPKSDLGFPQILASSGRSAECTLGHDSELLEANQDDVNEKFLSIY